MSTTQLQKYYGKVLRHINGKSKLLIITNDDGGTYDVYRMDLHHHTNGFLKQTTVADDYMISWHNYTYNGETCENKEYFLDKIKAGNKIKNQTGDMLTIVFDNGGYRLMFVGYTLTSDNFYNPLSKEEFYTRYIVNHKFMFVD